MFSEVLKTIVKNQFLQEQILNSTPHGNDLLIEIINWQK